MKIKVRRFLAVGCLVFLIAAACISLTKEIVVRSWIEGTFEKHLNLKVKIQEIYIDLFRPRLTLEGLYISNPPNYGRHWLANATEAIINYRPTSFFSKTFKVCELSLDILEVNIVKDLSGQVNLNSISHRAVTEAASGLLIEKVNLSIRRVTYQDLTANLPVKVYDLNIKNLEFRNIQSLAGLSEIIALKIFERIGINQIGITKEELRGTGANTNPILQAGSFINQVIERLREVVPG